MMNINGFTIIIRNAYGAIKPTAYNNIQLSRSVPPSFFLVSSKKAMNFFWAFANILFIGSEHFPPLSEGIMLPKNISVSMAACWSHAAVILSLSANHPVTPIQADNFFNILFYNYETWKYSKWLKINNINGKVQPKTRLHFVNWYLPQVPDGKHTLHSCC